MVCLTGRQTPLRIKELLQLAKKMIPKKRKRSFSSKYTPQI
jgi:hypothetical protein